MVVFWVTVDLLESIGTRGKARVHRGSWMGGVGRRAELQRESWCLMAGKERRGEAGYIIYFAPIVYQGLPWWLSGKESACQCRRCRFDPWVGKISWRRKWESTQVFLPGKSYAQRSLVGYSPWVCQRVRHDLVTKQYYLPCIVLRDVHGLSHFISWETNETGIFILPHTGESQRGWEMCIGTQSCWGSHRHSDHFLN